MSEEAYSVALRVAHPTYKPEMIANALNMSPDVANCVGLARTTPTGRPLMGRYVETYCAFTLINKTKGYFVDGLRALLPQIETHASFFNEIQRTGGRSELYIGVFVEGSSGFSLSIDDIRKLGEANLELSLDYYY